MSVEQVAVRNALVFRDDVHTHRWYDAIGEKVTKHLDEFISTPTDDTTNTLVNGSTFALTDVAGGAALLTCDTAENDGIKLQLGDELAGAGENIDLSGRNPLYCGIEFAINDVDQTDFLFGVSLTDTTVLDAANTAMYFRSVDESAVLHFVTELDTVESTVGVATLADNTYITAEFLYDVDGMVYVYINDALAASVADSVATFPNDELMRLTLEFLTGEGVANTCTIKWMRMIHIR